MANNRKKQNAGMDVYWGITALMLITAFPVGIVMVLYKLLASPKKGKQQFQVDEDAPLGARTTTGNARSSSPAQDLLAPLNKRARRRVRLGGALSAFCAIGLAATTADALPLLSVSALQFLSDIWFPLCCTAVSGAYALSGVQLRKRLRRWKTYLSMIGRRSSVPVSALANAAHISPDKVRRDLEEMLDEDVLPTGYLDYVSDQLILSSEGLKDEPAPKAEAAPKAASPAEDENAILSEIRAVNDLVKNRKLSEQIDRIGIITANILDYQKSHPQSAPQLHSFLSYYLPTTLKILRAYGQLEAQEVSGENITAAMTRIESMMDKVVEGFEKQLDQLFLGRTMDITSDVEVLERMLAKDGLSGDGMTLTL